VRTTITLDDDVAAAVRRLERAQRKSFKEIVNAALRVGLSRLEMPPERRRPVFRTKPLSVGKLKIGSVDDVSEVLAVVEGESYR
jgi:hypothetical protein